MPHHVNKWEPSQGLGKLSSDFVDPKKKKKIFNKIYMNYFE